MPEPTAVNAALDADIERALGHIPVDFGGGCSVAKAQVMARLIVEHEVDTAVEIGVYRGRSFIPLAIAMRARGAGRAIGIDPFAVEPAMQYDDHAVPVEMLHAFARETDWGAIKAGVEAAIDREGVSAYSELVQDTSAGAATRFAPASLGFVHIDGNHDRASVERDVATWLPLLRPGGLLVLDDASWSSVTPILAELRKVHELLLLVDDKHGFFADGPSDFAVLRIAADAPAPHVAAAAASRRVGGLKGRLERALGAHRGSR
jgi:predicted O-methyltransferase YrrM